VGDEAAGLEQFGWDGVLVPDNQNMMGDAYVAVTAAAMRTSRVKVGLGVTNPYTRHAAVAASAIATVQAMSGGRAIFGVGRGDSSLAHVGLAPASPRVFEDFVVNVQAYLRGDAVQFPKSNEPGYRSVTELGGAAPTESRLHWLDPTLPKVPMDVAASGPKVIAIGALHAEQLSFTVGADVSRLRWALALARESRERADLDPDGCSFGAYINVVAHHDESTARRLAMAGVSALARHSALHGHTSGPVDPAQQEQMQRLAAGYDLRQHGSADAAHIAELTGDFAQQFAVVGTPATCVERLSELADLGLDRFIVLGGLTDGSSKGVAELEESKEAISAEVLPALRSPATSAA
jgi:5,10-methylenetetrahydromethanopterin reductase